MATLRPHALTPAHPDDGARVRRWCVLAIVAAVLLGTYVAGVAWVTRQVEAGVDRSLQPLAEVVRDRPAQ